ncbi:MAG: hypothetical protein MJE68_24925 [Proteobacteria bacterium]|nr:hypothetical protein [Pseudomonadota bacterium]
MGDKEDRVEVGTDLETDVETDVELGTDLETDVETDVELGTEFKFEEGEVIVEDLVILVFVDPELYCNFSNLRCSLTFLRGVSNTGLHDDFDFK